MHCCGGLCVSRQAGSSRFSWAGRHDGGAEYQVLSLVQEITQLVDKGKVDFFPALFSNS
jgi:hypothetical protein